MAAKLKIKGLRLNLVCNCGVENDLIVICEFGRDKEADGDLLNCQVNIQEIPDYFQIEEAKFHSDRELILLLKASASPQNPYSGKDGI